jgi:hypothetical protein
VIDTTKWTGLSRMGTDAISLGWCAVGLLAAALGGRAPAADLRAELRSEPSPRVRAERVAPDSRPLGVLVSRGRQVVLGRVDPIGADAQDEIALTAESPCLVRYRVTPTLPGAELAVRIRNRTRGELGRGVPAGVLAFAAAGERRDLAVDSSWGASCYSLELEVLPLPSGADLAGP